MQSVTELNLSLKKSNWLQKYLKTCYHWLGNKSSFEWNIILLYVFNILLVPFWWRVLCSSIPQVKAQYCFNFQAHIYKIGLPNLSEWSDQKYVWKADAQHKKVNMGVDKRLIQRSVLIEKHVDYFKMAVSLEWLIKHWLE